MTENRPESIDPELTAAGLDGALEVGYSKGRHDAADDASVLLRLDKKGVPAPRVLLRDPAEEVTPVVRPGSREAPGGRYQTVGEVARGGVGVILKCRDVDLGRDVAMKVLRTEYGVSEQMTARFVEEAQIAGQLQHPGIVPVYELGLTDEQQPYFTMKFIKGDTLAARLSSREDPTDGQAELLGIFRQVCMTVAYAHSRGVIHRDLKPANVIIGAYGEVMVVDWGFAKVLAHGGVADERKSRAQNVDAQTIVHTLRSGSEPGSGTDSVAGSVMGTPPYMPPEQAVGDVDAMDSRSDVFGLGAILCEILTGVPPYVRGELSPVVQAAQGKLEDAFRRLDECGADGVLVSLCKRCLDVAPAKRPADGGVVGRAIAAHLQGVEERAEGARVAALTARRTRKWAMAAAATLLVGCGVSTLAWQDADTQRGIVEARNGELESVVYAAMLSRASDAIASGDLEQVEKILAETQPEQRGFEFEWLGMQAMPAPRPRIIDTGGGAVTVIELSPDASVVAVADKTSSVGTWDVATGGMLWRVPDLGHSLAWTPDGAAIAVLHVDGRLTFVDATNGEARSRTATRMPAYRVALSPDGQRVALTSLDGWVSVLSLDALTLEREFEVDRSVREICWSADGTRLCVTLADRAVVLDAATGERGSFFAMAERTYGTPRGAGAAPLSVDWSRSGDRVLVCFDGGASGIWSARTGVLVHELEPHAWYGFSGTWEAFSGRFCGANTVMTAGRDDRLRIHDVVSGKRRAMFGGVSGDRSRSFQPGGTLLIDSRVAGARWRGPGTPLLSWGSGDRLFVWDVAALDSVEDLEDTRIGSKVVCTPGGESLFYVTKNGELVRRDRDGGRVVWTRPLLTQGKFVPCSASDACRYLPEARAVVAVAADLVLTIVDADSGEVRRTIAPPAKVAAACAERGLHPTGIAVSHDELRIACAVGKVWLPRDYEFPAPVLVFDLGPAPKARVVGRHLGAALAVCFVPGTDQLASCGDSREVSIWDATRAVPWGQEPVAVRELSCGNGHGRSLAVSPDGRLLAVGYFGTAHVFDIETGRETLDPPIRLTGGAAALSFEPGSDRLLVVENRGAVQLVDLNGLPLVRRSLSFVNTRSCFLNGRSHILATEVGGRVDAWPLRAPPGSPARRHTPDEHVQARAAATAQRTWESCLDSDEVRERLIADPELDADVRDAALGIVPHLGDNAVEILRRITVIAAKRTVTAEERVAVMALLRRGLATTEPGSLGWGALLAWLTALERPAADSAKRGGLAEDAIAASEGRPLSVTSFFYRVGTSPREARVRAALHPSLPRAVLAARRGDRPTATAQLSRHMSIAAEAGQDGPIPQLVAEMREEVEMFLAR